MRVKIWFALLLSFSFLSPTWAATEVYIQNKSVTRYALWRGNQVFLPQDTAEKYLNCKIIIEPSSGIISINDSPITPRAIQVGNIYYIPLKPVAEQLGISTIEILTVWMYSV